MTYSIIPFEEKYQEDVKKLVLEVMQELRPGYTLKSEERNKDLNNIAKIYKGKSRFWILLSNNNVIGTVAILNKNNQTCLLKRLFLKNKYRKKGLGQRLLNFALAFAKNNNYKEIELITSHFAKSACIMFEKNNFKVFKDNGELIWYRASL
jgi:putative acetyltransferase